MIPSETLPAVTSGGPGRRCDNPNPLAFVCAEEIRASAEAAGYTFTCVFPDKSKAVVQVVGALSLTHARGATRYMWWPYLYCVEDGDLTYGHARPFILVLDGPGEEDQRSHERGCTHGK